MVVVHSIFSISHGPPPFMRRNLEKRKKLTSTQTKNNARMNSKNVVNNNVGNFVINTSLA